MRRLSKPKTAQDFVSGSPLERSLSEPEPPMPPELTLPTQPTQELNPRVMKQLNFDMPETDHHALKVLVASMPNMSVRRFLVAAVTEKMQRIIEGGRKAGGG